MSAWSEGAMDNVTTTVDDNDFDALLEASSLGAPSVIAAIGTTPTDARRRFEHAARHPQSRTSETTTTEDTGARSPEHHAPAHHLPASKSRPKPRTSSTVMTGMGKAAAYLQFIHSVYLAMSARRGKAARPPRLQIVVPDRRELLRTAHWLDGHAHPWPLIHDDLTGFHTQWPTVPAVPLYTALLRSRATLRDEAAAWFMDFRSLRFAPSCGSPMPPFVTAGDLREGTRGLERAIADSATSWNPATGVRETRNSPLPLCVRDDLIDTGTWVDDACVMQEAAWALDAYLRGHAARAALRRPAGEHLSWMSTQRQPKLPAWLAGGSLHRTSLLAAACLASCRLTEDALLAHALPTAHGADVRPACQSLGKLLHWRTLQAVPDQGWWHLLDSDCLKRRSEDLRWGDTRFLPHAVTLPCLDPRGTSQKVLWMPSPKQPSSRRTAAQGSPAAKSRPAQTCDAGTLIAVQIVRTEIDGKLHLSTPVGSLPLPTYLHYRADDPYAVEAVFAHENMDVSWTFARDLLTDGMRGQAGDGDVRVWPSTSTSTSTSTSDGARIFIELSPPAGTALVSLPRSYVQDFLNQTTDIVPIGTEHTFISPVLHTLEKQLSQLTSHPGSSG